MILRIYAFIFFVLIPLAYGYQMVKLQHMKKHATAASASRENERVKIAEISHFKTRLYEKDMLHETLSGDHIVFYSDNSFSITGHVLYEKYDAHLNPDFHLVSDKTQGQFTRNESSRDPSFLNQARKLESLYFPHTVRFQKKDLTATTAELSYDVKRGAVSSPQKFRLENAMGQVSGQGFHYNIKNETLKTRNRIKGDYDLQKDPQS